jgi:uncharacterized spore protein YtfJ
MDATTVKREASEQPAAPTFLERMVEKFGMHARSASAYSEPISKDGVTIVPVAKVRWGFGGGGGAKQGAERGGGGGGGMRVTPVGFIEIKDGRSEFKPIRDAASYVPIIIAGGAAGFFLLRALRKLLR